MAAVAPSSQRLTQPPPLPMYRFTVAQYHRMIDNGVFGDSRVELIEGWIVQKMTHNPPHDGTVLLVQTELLKRLPAEWVLRVQSAITLSDSEPEPDLAVAVGPARRYTSTHPRPRDIALVVEVADTTLDEDRGAKQRVYARNRIPCYWIVNLNDLLVEVYTGPRGGRSPGYRERRDYGPDDAVPLVIDGQGLAPVPVRDMLP
jgi:Uma2 family endonuclease